MFNYEGLILHEKWLISYYKRARILAQLYLTIKFTGHSLVDDISSKPNVILSSAVRYYVHAHALGKQITLNRYTQLVAFLHQYVR